MPGKDHGEKVDLYKGYCNLITEALDKQLRIKISDKNCEWRFDESFIIFKFVKTESQILVSSLYAKGPVIRATFFFNVSCNIVAAQVETPCCAYYHLREQLDPQQNVLLQISGILRLWLVSRV